MIQGTGLSQNRKSLCLCLQLGMPHLCAFCAPTSVHTVVTVAALINYSSYMTKASSPDENDITESTEGVFGHIGSHCFKTLSLSFIIL